MRINSIKEKSADVTLDASELVCLGNVLYFYEKHHALDAGSSSPGPTFHGLYKQVVTARDLCQYGRLDGHSLGTIVEHELAMSPVGQLSQELAGLRPELPGTGREAREGGEWPCPEKA